MAISNPRFANGTKNGDPLNGTVTLPLDSILYWFKSSGGSTFYTKSGVFQTSGTSFSTGFAEISAKTIVRNSGQPFKPAYNGATYFNSGCLIAILTNKDGTLADRLVFDWGDITLSTNNTLSTIRTALGLTTYIVAQLNVGGFIYANPAYSEIVDNRTASGVIFNNGFWGTTDTPEIMDYTPKTYSIFWAYNDPVKVIADKFVSITVNGTEFKPETPISLTLLEDVATYIRDAFDDAQIQYGTVSVDYKLTAVNNNNSVISITVSDCELIVQKLNILIDGGTDAHSVFAEIVPSVTVYGGQSYRCFHSYNDLDTASADRIVGLTLNGNARTFTGVELIPSNALAIQNSISALIAAEGAACEAVQFKVNQAQANGRATSFSIIILGSSITVNSVELDIDNGTPATANFSMI